MFLKFIRQSGLSFVSLLRISALALCFTIYCFAQSTGGIQGTVTDASGAVLSNADIDITNSATGQHQIGKKQRRGAVSLYHLFRQAVTPCK